MLYTKDNQPMLISGQDKKLKKHLGIEGEEQLSLFQQEINQIQLTDDDLKDLINLEPGKSKLTRFYEMLKGLASGFGIDTNNIKHISRIITVSMLPPLYSHTLAIGRIFKADRDTSIAFFAYAGGLFFALLFEFFEHIIGKFKNRKIAHIGSGIIGLGSYFLSMVGWHDFYSMESSIFGLKHILANILSIFPPVAIYAFTAQLYTLELEVEQKKEDKLKSGEKKKPYTRVKKFTRPQIENFLYELMANPNTSFNEFVKRYPDLGSSTFDKIKAAARKKLREHQTNKTQKD